MNLILFLRSGALSALMLAAFSISLLGAPAGETVNPRPLSVGESFIVAIDGYTGDMATTEPKTDANDGKDGDNPYYQRHNVARAHTGPFGGHWYSSNWQQGPGEPDPNDEQWVDYRPPLDILGPGRYNITAYYRQNPNRATYKVPYIIRHEGGTTIRTVVQNGPSSMAELNLGEYDLGDSGWVRVQDLGPNTVSFAHMKFTYLGPSVTAQAGSEAEQEPEVKTMISISPSGHYLTYEGKTLMIVGDSGTQCVMQNKNIDYRRWVDDCAARGIRSIHIWGLLSPRQKQDGSVMERRYGYVYPGLTPWPRKTSGPLANDQLHQWDLKSFDEAPGGYWPRLRDLCSYAKSKGIVVGIIPFFGWPKWDSPHRPDWSYHPFNVINGGHLTENNTVQIIGTPGKEVWMEEWSDEWPDAKKTQWIWERYSKKMIDDVGSMGNVWFAFMDEHTYPEGNCGDHFRDFFRSRGMLWADWDRRRATVDMVYEQPGGEDKNAATVRWVESTPHRPFLILEAGPYYMGDPLRTTIWTVSIGGGHYMFHNDQDQETPTTGIMGYDPNVQDSDRAADMKRRDWLGHAGRFFNDHINDLDSMSPHNNLGSEGVYVLANPGTEYAVYALSASPEKFTVNLEAVSGNTVCRFYNPRMGVFGEAFKRPGGGTQEFTKPDSDDWALLIQRMKEVTDLYLAPVPKSITGKEGMFSTNGKRFTQLISEDPQALMIAARQTGLEWEVTASPKAPKHEVGLVIRLCDESDILKEGYKLDVLNDRIEITAPDAAGAFYGASTLAQILRQCGDVVPCMSISDSPDFPVRGVMMDISRDKVPTMETLYQLVDLLSSLKINQFQLYTEHTFAYLAHPTVWEKSSPMTGEEILALDAYCRERFIDLVPNQNSFGHMHRWLKHEEYRHLAEVPDADRPFGLCPIDERSIEFLRGLYDELLPHFSSGLFNVCLDETFDLGHGRSKEACEELGTGRVYLDFLLEIYDAVKERGRTMMFWGDIIRRYPDLIPELPDDVIVLEWGYEADHPFEDRVKNVVESGLPFYLCPGTSSWNSLAGRTDNTIGNITSAARTGMKLGAKGILNTDWGDTGHWQPLSAAYLGFLAGAMASWNAETDVREGLAENLSLHVFKDRTGKAGRSYYDIGTVCRAFEARAGNQSVPWKMLFRAEPWFIERLKISEFEEMERMLDSISKAVEGWEMTSVDADIVSEELDHIIMILRFAAEVGKAKIAGTEVRDSERKIAEIKSNQERVWLMRNRIGGLSDSLKRLEEPFMGYYMKL